MLTTSKKKNLAETTRLVLDQTTGHCDEFWGHGGVQDFLKKSLGQKNDFIKAWYVCVGGA